MRLLLSTNVKDEKNIQEWIHYHLKLGVPRILIWDDFSEKPVISNDDRVEVRLFHAKKNEYMEKSVGYALEQNAEWTLHLDGDEYLYLGGQSIESFLDQWEDHQSAIVIPWLLFGSNFKVESTDGRVVPEYTRCNWRTSLYTKTLTRPIRIRGVLNAHIYNLGSDSNQIFYADGKKMNRYSSMYPEKMCPPTKETVCIAHYQIQSWEDFCFRRKRLRDDLNCVRVFHKLDLDQKIPSPEFHKDSNHLEFLHLSNFINNKDGSESTE